MEKVQVQEWLSRFYVLFFSCYGTKFDIQTDIEAKLSAMGIA